MDNMNIYDCIAERTNGDVYIGVVGPVRTGKSTFIKRFMDLLVIPNIENIYRKERTKDELPQSGTGKTIMIHYRSLMFCVKPALKLTGSPTRACLGSGIIWYL